MNIDWKPTCSIPMLRLRARLLQAVRQFFADRHYCEVETPLLSSDVVVDAHLEPIETIQPTNSPRRFLQTSPEAGMKRLLAAGSGSIFQITRSFRRNEFGERHNSEFTMLEWYGINTTWLDQMQLTEDLVRCVHGAAAQECQEDQSVRSLTANQFARLAYDDSFASAIGSSVLDLSVNDLRSLVQTKVAGGLMDGASYSKDDLLNVLLAECVEPELGTPTPEFLHSYPLSQAALAEQNPQDLRTALRFELYWNGLELCNGYQELTDPVELKRRDEAQNQVRVQNQTDQLPGAQKMLAAMQSGLPACSGVALGFDRLMMAILNCANIKDVIAFPDDIA